MPDTTPAFPPLEMTSSSDVISPSRPALVASLSLYALPVLVGVVGNVAILYVIVSHKTLRTAINAYIANMAVLDLLACAVLVPLRVLYYLDEPDVTRAGLVLCKAELFLHCLVDAGRLLLLAAISFERYQAVANPFQRDKSAATRRAFIALVVMWAVVVLYASLLTVFFEDTILFEYCMKQVSGEAVDYELWGAVEMYCVLPLSLITVTVIIVCYVLMFRVLFTQRNKMLGHNKVPQNKVAPLGGSVLQVKVQPGPAEVKVDPSGGVSVSNVTNVTTVGAPTTATTNVTTATTTVTTATTNVMTSTTNVTSAITDVTATTTNVTITSTAVTDVAFTSPVVSQPVSSARHRLGEAGVTDEADNVSDTELTNVHSPSPTAGRAFGATATPKDLGSAPTRSAQSTISSSRSTYPLMSKEADPSVSQTPPPAHVSCSSLPLTTNIQSSGGSLLKNRPEDGVRPSPPKELSTVHGNDNDRSAIHFQQDTRTAAGTSTETSENYAGAENRRPSRDSSGRRNTSLLTLLDSSDAPLSSQSVLHRSSIGSGHTDQENTTKAVHRPDHNILQNEDTENLKERQVLPMPFNSPPSVRSADKQWQVIGIHTPGKTPIIASVNISGNSSPAHIVTQTDVRRTARAADSADSGLNNVKPDTSDDTPALRPRDKTESSPTVEAKPSTPGDNPDNQSTTTKTPSASLGPGRPVESATTKTPSASLGPGRPVVSRETGSTSLSKGQPLEVKVVEVDGTEHVEQVAASQNIQGDVCMFNPKNRVMGRRKVEGRVAKRLAIIFVSFVLIWMPYPCAVLVLRVMYMHSSPSPSPTSSVTQAVTDVVAVLSALSMMTAAVNPVFYALANAAIRAVIRTAVKNVAAGCRRCRPRL